MAQLTAVLWIFKAKCIFFESVTYYSKKERSNIMEITKNTIIGDILDMDFDAAPYFLEIGMHCLGCPSARSETIEEACAVHGTDPEELVAKLNAHFAAK